MIVETLALLFPAYASSPLATLSKFLKKTHPIDFDRHLPDGKPLLGAGKTWEGTLIGTLGGGILGLFVYRAFAIQANPFLFAFLGLVGDMLGSFIKRRMGMERGQHAPLLDELDFLFPPLVYAAPPFPDVLIVVVITPVLHKLACLVGYALGVKREPW